MPMNNNNEEIRKELYNNMLEKSKNNHRKEKLKKIEEALEHTIKSFKIVFVSLIIIIVIAIMYFVKDSIFFYTDIEKSIEGTVGKVTLVSKDTDEYGIGTYTFKLDKIPQIEIHASKTYSTIGEDASARVYKYLFEKWNNSKKSKFIVKEYYIDDEFNDKTISNWLLEYSTCINITNYSELMEAIELVTDFSKYAEKMLDFYVHFGCSIQFNGEYIAPYNESQDKIPEYVQEWYVGIVKEKNLNYSDIPEEILEKY